MNRYLISINDRKSITVDRTHRKENSTSGFTGCHSNTVNKMVLKDQLYSIVQEEGIATVRSVYNGPSPIPGTMFYPAYIILRPKASIGLVDWAVYDRKGVFKFTHPLSLEARGPAYKLFVVGDKSTALTKVAEDILDWTDDTYNRVTLYWREG